MHMEIAITTLYFYGSITDYNVVFYCFMPDYNYLRIYFPRFKAPLALYLVDVFYTRTEEFVIDF